MSGVSAGTVVGGKYRLEEPIGRGGMASVWRATHTTLESSVAVKFLETFGSGRDKMAKRFLREARLAGGLKHRNVVQILDFGVMDDGQPFMVMELLEGTSLADRFDHGPPLSDVELFEIVAQVLSGLAAVHDAGIVHRDVKPDNIFLVRDADGDYPKLLDFGISRGVGAEAGDTRVTNTGAVIGTPLYMSPEQARGMSDVDRRTDVWSIGMVLWEGLTGELPFEAEHMGDVLIRVATEDAPSIALSRPDLPEAVVSLIGRALSRDREARFSEARAMREVLLEAANRLAEDRGEPARRRPSSRAMRTAKPTEDVHAALTREMGSAPRPAPRSPWPLVAGASALLVVLTGIAFIALGGEIRFSSAEAEASPQEAPADTPPPTVQAPTADAHQDVTGEDTADTSPADTSPADTSPADTAEGENPEGGDPQDESPEGGDPQDESAGASSANDDTAGVNHAPDTASPTPATRRSGSRARRRAATSEAPSNSTPPEPRDSASGRRPRQAPSSSRRTGGFLRDLDY